jgi:hypothetical protein
MKKRDKSSGYCLTKGSISIPIDDSDLSKHIDLIMLSYQKKIDILQQKVNDLEHTVKQIQTWAQKTYQAPYSNFKGTSNEIENQ